jgi:hypothetical protein
MHSAIRNPLLSIPATSTIPASPKSSPLAPVTETTAKSRFAQMRAAIQSP